MIQIRLCLCIAICVVADCRQMPSTSAFLFFVAPWCSTITEQLTYAYASAPPQVAAPHSPDNRKTARECSDVKIDRVYIGSCTGGTQRSAAC